MTRNDDIRKEILFQAYALRPLPVSASQVFRNCQKQRMDITQKEIERELPFLVGEKLLQTHQMPGVSEKHFDITSAGVTHYENNFAA